MHGLYVAHLTSNGLLGAMIQKYIQCCRPPGHPFAYQSAFFEDFTPNLYTTFSEKSTFLVNNHKDDVTKSNRTRMDTEIASIRNEITIHFIMQPPCVTLELSLSNLQYVNDGLYCSLRSQAADSRKTKIWPVSFSLATPFCFFSVQNN